MTSSFDTMAQPLVVQRQHIADIELPAEFQGLYDLAYNLWWTWSPRARDLFSAIDPRAWSLYHHNPVQVLINVDPHQWDLLLENDTFLEACTQVLEEYRAYSSQVDKTWFHGLHSDHRGGPVAYFSMEYGLHESLAIYSGGLGILSGDHLKSASDLGVPMVGVGLLYRNGYFRQAVDADGQQQHIYPDHDFARLPLRPAAGATGRDVVVSVPLPGREVKVKVWAAQVGRVPLLLLDTLIPANDPADRPITGTLYVRGRAMRLAQEIVLGVGGVRALAACGIQPSVWHINEGHSALLQLERMARAREAGAEGLDAARQEVQRSTVFTTHTPVPAGNEVFDAGLARQYLNGWPDRLGTSAEELLSLARGADEDPSFNLTVLALRTSRYVNGVSRLHGETSRRIWQVLFDAEDVDDVPISHITNGVHLPTWLGRELQGLLRRHLGYQWTAEILREEAPARIASIPDEELWSAHLAQKRQLGRFVRSRVRQQLARHGRSPEELRQVESFFLPEALTIGFARRFATYKRASLVFTDIDELRCMVTDSERPVQILFAGKAHPADRPGQELIQHIFQLSQAPPFQGRVFYLEDYDMRIGRMLVQGVDLWLNTPRRPQEASGTSGQKAAINGALNCSILDGWWPEAHDGTNGWAIEAEPEEETEPEQPDLADALALYRILADEIIPLFFERDEGGLPRRWLQRMKRSMATVAPRFSSDRMVRDYSRLAYFPDDGQGPHG